MEKQKAIPYHNLLTVYQESQSFEARCAMLTIYNNGTSNVIVNQVLTLEPTMSIAFDGKKGEVDMTNYFIRFEAAGENSCVVIRKYYDDDFNS